jgi:cell division protein FtsL
MNLRSKKPARRRKQKESNILLLCIAYAFVVGISFFGVFSYTIYLDGNSEKINKNITVKDQEIYKLQREIQNLKIKMENHSRKDYIVSKINNYELNLRTPGDFQVVNLSSRGFYADIPSTNEVAYNY